MRFIPVCLCFLFVAQFPLNAAELKKTKTFEYASPDAARVSDFIFLPQKRSIIYALRSLNAAPVIKCVDVSTRKVRWATTLPQRDAIGIIGMMPSTNRNYCVVLRNTVPATANVEVTIISLDGKIVHAGGFTTKYSPIGYHNQMAFSAGDGVYAHFDEGGPSAGTLTAVTLPENKALSSVKYKGTAKAIIFKNSTDLLLLDDAGVLSQYNAVTGKQKGAVKLFDGRADRFIDLVSIGGGLALFHMYNNSLDKFLLYDMKNDRVLWEKNDRAGGIPDEYSRVVILYDRLVFLDKNNGYIANFEGAENGPVDAFEQEKARGLDIGDEESVINTGTSFIGYRLNK